MTESRALPLIALGCAGLVVALALLVAAAVAAIAPGGGVQASAAESGVSAFGRADIPAAYLRLYLAAAGRYGLDWAVLAGIGRVECDHGRDPDPSCSVAGVVNPAGAGGPMQFLAGTWRAYGVDADGDGRADRWDPADAIFAAARYLRASGAPGDYPRALFAYNHSGAYVRSVETWAARYRAAGGGDGADVPGADSSTLAERTPTPVSFVAGARAVLAPGDGHLALVPVGVPLAVQAMVVAGNELEDLPYGPGGHPDPLGAGEEDCSSTVNYVLYRAGVRPLSELLARNPVAQSYVHWGLPGPGRWVTIYAADEPTPHVFMTIAGLRLDTSHDGTDVGPNRDEDGPRWRILDHIPTWARWSIRHPPGL